jgi:6-phosphogluconolactonase (cycloisomerase 2 family)
VLPPLVVAAPGTGPRHLVRTGDGALLLVGELAGDLSWYRPAAPDGAFRREGGQPATTVRTENFPSEITSGRDGRFVYVGNRGADTVAVFAWDGRQATPVAEVPTGGQWPRHIARFGDHLYVANERSQTVTAFRVDPGTGVPTAQGAPLATPSPTCLIRWNPVQIKD